MRVGIVCEGQTDYITMKSFLSAELTNKGKTIEFDLIQPALDNTLPGGWSQVAYWLEQNPLANRNAVYLKGQAVFSLEEDDRKFDVLIFQIDTDIIGETGFENFISQRGIDPVRPISPVDRSKFIQEIINKLAGHASLSVALTAKEVPIALVESCETWIVAAASSVEGAETLTTDELRNSFGAVVAQETGHPVMPEYQTTNKKVKTRVKICESLSKKASPATKAPHFDQAVHNLCEALDRSSA